MTASSIRTSVGALLAAGLAAQSVQVPATPSPLPANARFASLGPGTRLQILVDGAALGGTGRRPIHGLGLLLGPEVPAGGNAPALALRLGHSVHTPAAMTPSFSRNATSPPQTVFTGNLQIPAAAAPTMAHVQFVQPFEFDRALGNLLIEVSLPQGAARSLVLLHTELAVAVAEGVTGERWYPGNGVVAHDLRSDIALEPATGALSLAHHTDAIDGQFVFVLAGLSTTHHGALTLPWSMAPIGAPGQWLQVAPQTVLASTGVFVTQCGFPMHRDGVRWRLPLDGRFAGARYHVQSMALGGQRSLNHADVSMSDVETIRLGGMTSAPTQVLWGMGTEDVGRFDMTLPSSRAIAFESPVVQVDFGAQ